MIVTSEGLADVLGPVFWSAEFPSQAAANEHAAHRMAARRQAVSWESGGRFFAAWGVVGSLIVDILDGAR